MEKVYRSDILKLANNFHQKGGEIWHRYPRFLFVVWTVK